MALAINLSAKAGILIIFTPRPKGRGYSKRAVYKLKFKN
jgi:hypothetical protein